MLKAVEENQYLSQLLRQKTHERSSSIVTTGGEDLLIS